MELLKSTECKTLDFSVEDVKPDTYMLTVFLLTKTGFITYSLFVLKFTKILNCNKYLTVFYNIL